MLEDGDKIAFNSLGSAFRSAFEWIARQRFNEESADPGAEWARLVSSGIDGALLTSAPQGLLDQPFLPFFRKHRINSELYKVASGGSGGGPNVDVLLQIWLDCETRSSSYGTCLNFYRLEPFGLVPAAVWSEMQVVAGHLSNFTPASFFVIMAKDGMFELNHFGKHEVVITNAEAVRSSLVPLHLSTLRPILQPSCDLANGWMADPALSGKEFSPVLDRLLKFFNVNHVLRIRVHPA